MADSGILVGRGPLILSSIEFLVSQRKHTRKPHRACVRCGFTRIMNRKELTNHALEVFFDGCNAAQSEVLNEHFQYTFRDESRECRPDVNVFHP